MRIELDKNIERLHAFLGWCIEWDYDPNDKDYEEWSKVNWCEECRRQVV